jgi:hypothetical protein
VEYRKSPIRVKASKTPTYEMGRLGEVGQTF